MNTRSPPPSTSLDAERVCGCSGGLQEVTNCVAAACWDERLDVYVRLHVQVQEETAGQSIHCTESMQLHDYYYIIDGTLLGLQLAEDRQESNLVQFSLYT